MYIRCHARSRSRVNFSTWEYNSNPNIYMAYKVHIKIHRFYFEDMTTIASQRMKGYVLS